VCDQASLNIPWPSGWASNVKSALLHVISLAHYAITCARGWAANSINARVRLAARKPGDASQVVQSGPVDSRPPAAFLSM